MAMRTSVLLIPKEEAARASFLSRRWRSVLSYFHVMIFDQPAFECDENVFSENIKKMERDFCGFIDHVIHRRRECSVQTLEITIWNGNVSRKKLVMYSLCDGEEFEAPGSSSLQSGNKHSTCLPLSFAMLFLEILGDENYRVAGVSFF